MRPPRILIVEDESIVALDLKLHLQKLGYEVPAIADTGEQAMAEVAQQHPDAILMDVRLRGPLDGIETAARIRRAHDVPVVFLTSHSDDETVQRAAETAPYGYLTKPYQLRELRAGVEVALAKARMERQLRESDRWFAHTLRCVADGVVLTDPQGLVRFLNPAAEALTGWTVDAAAGQRVDVVAPGAPGSGAGAAADLVQRVLDSGRPAPVQLAAVLAGRDGRTVAVDASAGPVDDEHGQRLGAVLVLREATQRLAQEAALRGSEERFRSAFEHAPLGMALVSLGGALLHVNAALCRLLGADAEKLEQHTLAGLSLAADREHEARRLAELRSAGEGVVQFERAFLRLDGSPPVHTLVSVSLLHSDDRAPSFLYQVHDLTAQRLAAARLAELAEQRLQRDAAELASQAKSEFLSRASHEMRTPLNAVIGFAQLLEFQRDTDPPKAIAYARHIKAAGEHLLHLVNDVLDINRSAQGRLTMQPQALDLAAALREVADLLAPMAAEHGVDIAVRVADGQPVLADATRLRQVLLNLGSNAVKYNQQGGHVCFEATAAEGDRVLLAVQDTGIGMTPEQLQRLYQPFERLGRERSRIPGVGLGLVIAKALVADMGGDMVVSSQPQVGTRVTFHLPMPDAS